MKLSSFYLALCLVSTASAFSIPSRITSSGISNVNPVKTASKKSASLFPAGKRSQSALQPLLAANVLSTPEDSSGTSKTKRGLFTFKSKYGYLNPFAIYYGFISIFFGIPWFFAITACQIFYKLTNNKIDKFRRIPVFFSTIWGHFLLSFTGCYPEVQNPEILEKFFKEGRAAMFVANHNSWMDIPFVGTTVGWRNYKLISKTELLKVPILGKAIEVGGHVIVDRASRRSQMRTLKSGMKWLKDGVHLCAFPEGTRSKTGRLLPFKNGVYKMASKVGAPIIPLSIVAAGEAHPSSWMFPRRSCRGICKVVVHEPIESNDKTEAELAELVRAAVIDGLPEHQRPLE